MDWPTKVRSGLRRNWQPLSIAAVLAVAAYLSWGRIPIARRPDNETTAIRLMRDLASAEFTHDAYHRGYVPLADLDAARSLSPKLAAELGSSEYEYRVDVSTDGRGFLIVAMPKPTCGKCVFLALDESNTVHLNRAREATREDAGT